LSRASAKASGKPRRTKRSRRRSDRSQSTLEIIEDLLERRLSINVNGEPTQATALQAIMFQLLQRISAGDARAMRTYLQYQEFAARRSTKATELQFDDDQGGRSGSLKERL
jgi:Family of unknown function (DUF5681)